MSGYVPIGKGLGAAVLWNGLVSVVAGPIFAQIERERAEGTLHTEALREANQLRARGYFRRFGLAGNHYLEIDREPLTAGEDLERAMGCPAGWFAR